MKPLRDRLLFVVGWTALLVVVVWPAVALCVGLWTERSKPSEVTFDAVRYGRLLSRSAGLAFGAATCAVLLSLPIAFALTRRRLFRLSVPLAAAALSTLLAPPMVYVFGWQRILGAHWNPYVLTVAVWALWGWPIATALLATTWLRTGHAAYEGLLLDTSAVDAFIRSAAGPMRKPIFLCVFLLSAVFLNEYSVPHACGLTVYATELLGVATSSSVTRDTLLASLPLVGLLLATGAGLRGLAPARFNDLAAEESRVARGPVGRTWIPCVAFSLAWLTPTAALMYRADVGRSVLEANRLYRFDLFATFGVGVAAGLLALPIAWCVAKSDRWRRSAVALLTIVGFVPAVLVGEAFISGYNRPFLAVVADHWPVLVLAQTARFAWIPTLVVCMSLASLRTVREQAEVDGAGRWPIAWFIEGPLTAPQLLAALLCMIALACGETPLTSLLRVPDYDPIPLLIIEKFHRFEDGLLAALSLSLVAFGLACGTSTAWFLTRKPGQ